MKLRASLLLATLVAAWPAHAQGEEGVEPTSPDTGEVPDVDLVRAPDRAPKDGTPLISNMLYSMQYRLEFTGFFDFSYGDKYIEHIGGHGAVGFHVFDWLAIEGFGGYLVGDETNIASRVRQTGQNAQRLGRGEDCATERCEPELPDLWQTTWFAGAAVQWAPIYGKLSVVSEYDLNFQLYGVLGGTIEGVRKRLNNGEFDLGQGFRPSVNYGVGLRLIPWRWVALRLELRNYTGINPEVPELGAQGTDQCKTGYTLQVGGRTDCYTDFSNNAMVQLGVSFLL